MGLVWSEDSVTTSYPHGMHWIRDSTRYAIYHRDKFRCLWCGATGVPLSLDHVIPISKGGSNRPYNLLTCCETCNTQRLTSSFDAWTDSCNFDLVVYKRIMSARKTPLNRVMGRALHKERSRIHTGYRGGWGSGSWNATGGGRTRLYRRRA